MFDVLNQNLGVNPDIILLGGTEIDVAQLYREGQKQLQKLENQVQELDEKRRLLQESAAKFEHDTQLLKKELKRQEKLIAEQEKSVARSQARLKKAESDYLFQQEKLNTQEYVIIQQEKAIKEEQARFHAVEEETHQQQTELENKKKLIVEQEQLIARQQAAVEREQARLKDAEVQYQLQQKKLNLQELVIRQQRQVMQEEKIRLKAAEEQATKLQAFIKNQEQQVKEKLEKYEQLAARMKWQEEEIARQEMQILERAATIRKQDETISNQTERLTRQSDIIVTQKNYLSAMTLAVVFGALLAIVTLLSYRSGKRANETLTKQNLMLEKTTDELAVAKKAAEQANRAKTVFLTTMSHELRTPLNAILGFSQLMQRDPAMPDAQKEKLGIINRSGEHLLTLINDVLEVSKIEAGRIALNTSTFDLHNMLTGIEGIFTGRIEEKDVQLIFEKDEALPQFITADQGKVRQVLINLLGNALKFTEKGSISLRASLVQASQPAISDDVTEDHTEMLLRFEVTDTGIGIAKEDFSKIFNPFEQAKDGASKEGSTGLGLSISQRYAQLMGGNITFTSERGVGTTFCVEIKAQAGKKEDEETAQLLPAVLSLAPDQPEIRVLVVDDIASNRLLLSKILSSVGFKVREAENGKIAMDIYHEWRPQLLLLDVKMPVMGGDEVTKRIRAMKEGKDVTIIIVSASVFGQQRQQLLDSGANAYLGKPVKEELLFTEIQRHMNVRYLYQEEGADSERQKITKEDISELPESLRKAFGEAILVGDIGQLGELAAEACNHNAIIGAALNVMVEKFDLKSIQKLFTEEREPE